MGKTKKGIADKVRKAKNVKTKNVFKVQNNPFEVKINKQKHNILGRKTKHDRGLPGVSRSKANKKRKDTILKEYKDRHKTNNVLDDRFGEETTDISVEEKMLQRFAMEKKKKHEKMSMFSLNDEEELTHFGQCLADIDDFGTNAPSDDEDAGVISGEYVSEAHFGGGIFSKKSKPENEVEEEKPKSRKEIIDEIILKSKKAKFEKQNAQEQTNDLREKLDNTWQEVELLLKSSTRTTKDKEQAKDTYKPDDYDVAVKQMQYDKKAAPAARAQTAAEKAAEEAARLRKLEEERLQRMQPDYDSSTKKSAHRSADELNYDFLPEKVHADPVQYKDGVMVGTEDLAPSSNEDNWQLEPVFENEEGDEQEEEENASGQDDDSEEENDEDEFSDILSDNDDGAREEELSSDDDADFENDSGTASLDKEGLNALKMRAEKFPASYEDFCILMETRYERSCEKCVASLRNRFPPAAAKGNKEKLKKLFEYVWHHIHNLCLKEEPEIGTVDELIRHLYELCQTNPTPSAKFVVEELKKSQRNHLSRNGKMATPNFAYLIQFKLIKILFSTSDFCHPVCTPATLFMCHIVHSCRPANLKDLSSCLFVCTLLYEYVCFSKKFIPECVNFLCAAICSSVPKVVQQTKGIPSSASLYLNGKNCELLVVKTIAEEEEKPNLVQLITAKFPDSLNTEEIRLQLLRLTLRLCLKFILLYGHMPCFKEIFDPVKITCSRALLGYRRLNQGKEHPLATLFNEVQNEIQRLVKKRPSVTPLVQSESNKPKALPLYDPKIEEVGEPFQKGNRKKTSAAKRERERLQHKYKRELKGAVREIKKDARFLAREQLNEQIEKDNERAAKVKRLFGFLSNQEGEVKKINRKKFKLDLS